MANYRIICTTQEPVAQPNDRAHIVAVGTGETPDQYNRYWALDEVLSAMDQGHVFYTQGKHTGKVAYVEKYRCGNCTRTHIRSNPDAVQDNNLDNLPRCAR
jgi:hypothetical protein